MAKSKTPKAVLGLGDELVREFKVEHDTLGRWVAHDLAEKLLAYKVAKGSARDALSAEIRSRIFQFWKHRATLPDGVRPFEHYGPVLRALESLDPKRGGGRYYNYDFDRPGDKSANNEEVATWLNIAGVIDRGARSIITLCIASAAKGAGKPPDRWLKAAAVLADDDDLDVKVVFRFVDSERPAAEEKPDPNAAQREKLKRIRVNLSAMAEASVVLTQHLDEELALLDKKPTKRKR